MHLVKCYTQFKSHLIISSNAYLKFTSIWFSSQVFIDCLPVLLVPVDWLTLWLHMPSWYWLLGCVAVPVDWLTLWLHMPSWYWLLVCAAVPVDWLTLWLHMPFMILYSDIRQGLFYSVLLCFWVIFAGEHMMVCWALDPMTPAVVGALFWGSIDADFLFLLIIQHYMLSCYKIIWILMISVWVRPGE